MSIMSTRNATAAVKPAWNRSTQREDALEAIKLYYPVNYDAPFSPVPGVTVTFRNAGHILGLSRHPRGSHGERQHIKASGSQGISGAWIYRCFPRRCCPSDVDYLLMECTYGSQRTCSVIGCILRLSKKLMIRNARQRGKVIIPAFAVGRTQEIVYLPEPAYL